MKRKLLLLSTTLVLLVALLLVGCAAPSTMTTTATATVPGPTVTQTVGAGATATITATATSPGPTVTNTATVTATAPGGAAQPIVLKAAGWTDISRLKQHGLDWFAERIFYYSSGRLKLDFRGGPEAIPSEQQGNAVATGIVDVLWHHNGAFTNVPQNGLMDFNLHNPDGTAPPEIGAFLNKYYTPLNVKWMGQMRFYGPWYIVSNKPVNTFADFAKISIITSNYRPFLDFISSLGAKPVSTADGEEFTSLQQGLGDAELVISDDWKLGLQDVSKYLIMPSWRWHSNTSLYMNLKTFNGLSADLQKVITDVVASIQRDAVARDVGLAGGDLKVWQSKLQVLTLTGADAQKYANSYAENVAWPIAKAKVTQAEYDEMRKLAVLAKGANLLPN